MAKKFRDLYPGTVTGRWSAKISQESRAERIYYESLKKYGYEEDEQEIREGFEGALEEED